MTLPGNLGGGHRLANLWTHRLRYPCSARQTEENKISDDFAPKLDKKGNPIPVTRDWGNLAYVAVTRAKLVLDPGPLATVGS